MNTGENGLEIHEQVTRSAVDWVALRLVATRLGRSGRGGEGGEEGRYSAA